MEMPRPWFQDSLDRFYGGGSFVCLLEREDKDRISDLMAILLVTFLQAWRAESHYWHQIERTGFFFSFWFVIEVVKGCMVGYLFVLRTVGT